MGAGPPGVWLVNDNNTFFFPKFIRTQFGDSIIQNHGVFSFILSQYYERRDSVTFVEYLDFLSIASRYCFLIVNADGVISDQISGVCDVTLSIRCNFTASPHRIVSLAISSIHLRVFVNEAYCDVCEV